MKPCYSGNICDVWEAYNITAAVTWWDFECSASWASFWRKMSAVQSRPHPTLRQLLIIPSKNETQSAVVTAGASGSLSPGLQPNTPPSAISNPLFDTKQLLPLKVENFLLIEALDTVTVPGSHLYKAIDLTTQQTCLCKVGCAKWYYCSCLLVS